jgi:hypothetical protein
MGAGIGWEFGHAYDIMTNTWSIWQWETIEKTGCKTCGTYQSSNYASLSAGGFYRSYRIYVI